jgi:hypothetical protein
MDVDAASLSCATYLTADVCCSVMVMLMLILQIVLVALVVYEIASRVLSRRRLTHLENQMERRYAEQCVIVQEIVDLTLLTRRHDEEITTLRRIARPPEHLRN